MKRKFKKWTKNSLKIYLIIGIVLAHVLQPLSAFAQINTSLKTKQLSMSSDESENFVYLTDLDWLPNPSLTWKNKDALKKDENVDGDLISLMIEGQKKYFLRGLLAHATSIVKYDLANYKQYDKFQAYVGVDSSRIGTNGNVKFYIYGATLANVDNEPAWVLLDQTDALVPEANAHKVDVEISEYDYLILKADMNGNESSDHAVYAGAMLYDSNNYVPKEIQDVDWIKPVEAYDKDILIHNAEDFITNDSYRLTLLQRTLVSNVGYEILQAWVTNSDENKELLTWLFNDVNRLEEYLLGGKPNGSYIKSLNALVDIYSKHKSDFNSDYKNHQTLQKLMFATSLTHAGDVSSWFSGENGGKTKSTALGRYEVLKELYEGAKESKKWQQTVNGTEIPYEFEWEQFEDLKVEEMRWVTDNQLSDQDLRWLNWYITATNMKLTQYSDYNGGAYNPYTYINYGNGGNVTKDTYYQENPMCGSKNEFLTSDRNTSCTEKYFLDQWPELITKDKSKPTLWIAFEEDGVCGTLMHVGANIRQAFGLPSAGLGQPGHGAYLWANRAEKDGHYYTKEWTTYNWVSDWDKSEKGERMLLDWGTRKKNTVFNGNYNLIYLTISQKALNNYENYRKAQLLNFLADAEPDANKKIAIYKLALDKYMNYHIDIWYKLLTLAVNDKMASNEVKDLGIKMMNSVKDSPIAIYELSKIIENYLSKDDLQTFKNNQYNILVGLTTTQENYMNVGGVRAVAKSMLGIADNLKIASFSFTGENANILKLEGIYRDTQFEYTLDYNYDPFNKTDNSTWITADSSDVDLTSKLEEINATNDIVIHLTNNGSKDPNNLFVIDITETSAPNKLYANNLEGRVIGTTDDMEWQIVSNKNERSNAGWTKFSEGSPEIKENGITIVNVRYGKSNTSLESDTVTLEFERSSSDKNYSYIPISRLTADGSSEQSKNEGFNKVIDGNKNTMWHGNYTASNDLDRFIKIGIDKPVKLSKIDYVPRQDNSSNGNFTKVKIEVSLDNENWTTIVTDLPWANNKDIKSYNFTKPVDAQYVKITALESSGGWVSAAMINLYEDLTIKSIDDLTINYNENGYVYNGSPITPQVEVKDEDKILTLDVDYTITYQNNVNAGEGKIIITGIGEKYEGSKVLTFNIAKAYPSLNNKEFSVGSNIDSLKDISLPNGWSWQDPNIGLNYGINEVVAVYNEDQNYNSSTQMIKVYRDEPTKNEETNSSLNNNLPEASKDKVSSSSNNIKPNNDLNKNEQSNNVQVNDNLNNNKTEEKEEKTTDNVTDNKTDNSSSNKNESNNEVKEETQKESKNNNYIYYIATLSVISVVIVGIIAWKKLKK